jgi:hypothetical protein
MRWPARNCSRSRSRDPAGLRGRRAALAGVAGFGAIAIGPGSLPTGPWARRLQVGASPRPRADARAPRGLRGEMIGGRFRNQKRASGSNVRPARRTPSRRDACDRDPVENGGRSTRSIPRRYRQAHGSGAPPIKDERPGASHQSSRKATGESADNNIKNSRFMAIARASLAQSGGFAQAAHGARPVPADHGRAGTAELARHAGGGPRRALAAGAPTVHGFLAGRVPSRARSRRETFVYFDP